MATTIYLRPQTEDLLFDGAPTEALAHTDIPASIARFTEIWTERVQATYPDAAIETGRGNLTYVDAPDYAEGARMEELVQRLAEELFDDGNLWIVEA